MITQYVPDVIAGIVAKVSAANVSAGRQSVKFEVGHYNEVTKQLTLKTESIKPTTRDKYPVIWLIGDFDETINPFPGKYARVALHLIIATDTLPTYDMNDRRDKTFLPILYPIYSLLMQEISNSVALGRPRPRRLQHTKTDRPYWGNKGVLGNNEANLWNDFIDAIEIKNLNIQLTNLC